MTADPPASIPMTRNPAPRPADTHPIPPTHPLTDDEGRTARLFAATLTHTTLTPLVAVFLAVFLLGLRDAAANLVPPAVTVRLRVLVGA